LYWFISFRKIVLNVNMKNIIKTSN
jgi:hypothetical protein